VTRAAFHVAFLLGFLIFGAAACGGASHTVSSRESQEVVDQDTTLTSESSPRVVEETALKQPPPPPPPPPPPRFVLGHPSVRGKIFFADELLPVLEAVEKKLGEDGVEVVSSKQVLVEREIVRSGKLPGGKTCQRLPDPLNVSQGLHQAQVAEIKIYCDESSCVLSINSPKVGFQRALVLSANSDELVVKWAEEIVAKDWSSVSIPEIEEFTPELGRVRAPYLVPSNIEGVLEKDPAKALQRAASLAHRCEKQSASEDPLGQRYLLEIDPNGKVARCESERPDLMTPGVHSCTCNALKRQVRYPRAKKGEPVRRSSMNLHVKAKDTDETRARNSRVELQFSASDDPIAHLGFSTIPVTKMARCADMVNQETEVGISLEIAGQGEHVAHSTRWVGDVPENVKACVKELVREVRMTCPANDRATVKGKMVLRAPN